MLSTEQQIQEILDDIEYLKGQKASIEGLNDIQKKAVEQWNSQIEDLLMTRLQQLDDLGYDGEVSIEWQYS